MPAHIHAELMKQYAEDAMQTDKPWELWEYSDDGGKTFYSLHSSLHWSCHAIYRRKQVQKTRKVILKTYVNRHNGSSVTRIDIDDVALGDFIHIPSLDVEIELPE